MTTHKDNIGMINFFYFTRINFQSERAHVYNVAKTCEALQGLRDVSVSLVSTDNSLHSNYEKNNFFYRHSVDKKSFFRIFSLSSWFSNARGYMGVIFSNFTLTHFLFKNRRNIDVVYIRDHLLFPVLWLAKYFFKKRVVFENHNISSSGHKRILVMLSVMIADGVVAISHELRQYLKRWNKNIIVAFCGAAEKARFDYNKSKNELREELNLPKEKVIIGYTGNMGSITGNTNRYQLEPIIEALAGLSKHIIFVGVGEKRGNAKWIREHARRKKVSDRTFIYPQSAKERIPLYQRAFDILVVPGLKKMRPGDSPLKMFEYLAVGRPIIASKNLALDGVLEDEKNAIVVEDDLSNEWVSAFKKVLNDSSFSARISEKALQSASKFTWESRAKSIRNIL